jgi:hypothetical protein
MDANTVSVISSVVITIATVVLVIVTARYVRITNRILGANEEMAKAAWRSYLQSVVPNVECIALDDWYEREGDKTVYYGRAFVANKGNQPIRVVCLGARSASGATAACDYDRRLMPNESDIFRGVKFDTVIDRVVVEIEDCAEQRHERIAQHPPQPAEE